MPRRAVRAPEGDLVLCVSVERELPAVKDPLPGATGLFRPLPRRAAAAPGPDGS
ncbi:hypothetical protein [Streptomyces abyssomicinicus]|uniref:hypothetical protein n=1 Tax=Streptomyces abyssomicinicus TaxID=574929 RepID=UPI0013E0AB42|nr:hypothetical protein [Streptomyces abyssomicinicus]